MRCPSCGDVIKAAMNHEGASRRCGACGRGIDSPAVINLIPEQEVAQVDPHQAARRLAHDALDWARMLGSIIDLDVATGSTATQAERLARRADNDEEILLEARGIALDAKLPESTAAAVLLTEALRRSTRTHA